MQGTMQLLVWQPAIVGVAYLVMDCSDVLGAAPDVQGMMGNLGLGLIIISPGGWIDVGVRV